MPARATGPHRSRLSAAAPARRRGKRLIGLNVSTKETPGNPDSALAAVARQLERLNETLAERDRRLAMLEGRLARKEAEVADLARRLGEAAGRLGEYERRFNLVDGRLVRRGGPAPGAGRPPDRGEGAAGSGARARAAAAARRLGLRRPPRAPGRG